MKKVKNPNGVNIEGAGQQEVGDALKEATNPHTQASLDEFSEAIDAEAEEAKPRISEEDWQDVVDETKEVETEYEREIDSRAEKYGGEGYEAIPEGERPEDVSEQTTAQSGEAADGTPSQAHADTEMVVEREGELVGESGEYEGIQAPERGTVSRRQPTARSDIDSGVVEADEIHNEHTIANEVFEREQPYEETFDAVLDKAHEGEYYEDAEAVVAGREELSLPQEKQIEAEPSPNNAVAEDSLSNDEVAGIDFDNLEPPESSAVADRDIDEETGFHEMVEQVACENATDEIAARESVSRHNDGEAPAQDSRISVDSKDFQGDRPWTGDEIEGGANDNTIYRFVPAGNGVDNARDVGIDTFQSPEFIKEVAKEQPTDSVSDSFDIETVDRKRVEYDTEEYSNVYEAITKGDDVFADVEPAPVAQPLTPEHHDNVGPKASENLRGAGYKKVSDLANATVSDLTSVDGIGEGKAKALIENEGATARRLRKRAEQLDKEITNDEFNADDYQRIIEYCADKGLSVEKSTDVLTRPNIRKEMPGPTPVTELKPGEGERRAKVNSGADTQYVNRDEAAGGTTTYRPTNTDEHSYAPPITVEGMVTATYTPNDSSEHQVVELMDHEGNRTKFTVYRDSLHEPEDEPTSGYSQFGTTHPDDGVDPNIALAEGDPVRIKNPQINDYGGGDHDRWDGKTLATTPDTAIETEAQSLRSVTETKVGKGMVSRGSEGGETGAPDYTEGSSREIRRREREYEKKHGSKYNPPDDPTESPENEERDTDDVYSH